MPIESTGYLWKFTSVVKAWRVSCNEHACANVLIPGFKKAGLLCDELLQFATNLLLHHQLESIIFL